MLISTKIALEILKIAESFAQFGGWTSLEPTYGWMIQTGEILDMVRLLALRKLSSETNPKDHWTLKTSYFEDPTPAIQVQTLPLEGPRSLGKDNFPVKQSFLATWKPGSLP